MRGHTGVAVYSATKTALGGMTRSLARELGPRNIQVNSLAPGYFQSDMVGDLPEGATARIKRRAPLEVEALRRCIATDPDVQAGGCWLGSVKTNIGHLEQTAGVASLIKAATALDRG